MAPPHTPWVKSVGKVSLLDRLALVGLRSGNGEWNPVGTRLGPGQEPGWNPVKSPVGTRSGAQLGPGQEPVWNPVEVLLKMHSPKQTLPHR